MTDQQITMGAGLTTPERAFTPPAETDPAGTPGRPSGTAAPTAGRLRHLLLAAAAASAPAFFAAYVAVDPAPLPREPAAEFLGAIAADPTAFVVSVVLQVAAMTTGIALAVHLAATLGRRAPLLAPLVGTLLTLGYVGGIGFAGAKTVAADLVADGAVRPGAVEVWSAVHTGPLFDVMSWPLLMAIPGNVLLAVLLVRCRGVVGLWPAPVVLAGFVLGSGEFPDAVTLLGWLVQVPAVLWVVARTLRAGR